MNRRTAIVPLLSAAVLCTMAGCADQNKELEPRTDTRPMVGEIRQAEQDWAWIAAQQWYLESIEGALPIPGTRIRLSFKEHTWLEGDAGCNRFTASYTRKANAGLQVSEILSTKMYCAHPDGVMQQESRFFHLLQSIDAYLAQPDRLDLYRDDTIVLSFMNDSSPSDN